MPEEKIRKSLIEHLVQEKGFKRSLIVTEKKLSLLPHLKGKPLPIRRCDLICFAKDPSFGYDLVPLILIECKAVPLSKSVFDQVIGYNHYIQALYIAIANEDETWLAWMDPLGKHHLSPEIPSYEELLTHAKERGYAKSPGRD